MKTAILLLALSISVSTGIYLESRTTIDGWNCSPYTTEPVRQLTMVKCNDVIYYRSNDQ